MRVGFVGLGDQGGGIALRLLEQGVEMLLYARRPAALEPFRETGAALAGSLRELGEKSDLLGVCVFDDAQLEAVLLGDAGALGAMRRGAAIAVHSTVNPQTVHALARAAAERGVDVLDAPVSGGRAAAQEGRLAVMVGGEAAVFERCLPVFRSFGEPVRHMGPLGAGQLAKLVNNVLFTANTGLVRRAREVGRALGIDPEALCEVLRGCSGRSFALECFGPAGDPRTRALLGKDLALVADVARRAETDLGCLRAAADDALSDPRIQGGSR